jgi:hypothetical protein
MMPLEETAIGRYVQGFIDSMNAGRMTPLQAFANAVFGALLQQHGRHGPIENVDDAYHELERLWAMDDA